MIEVFKVAGLSLLRVPVQSSYNAGELSSRLAPHFVQSAGTGVPAPAQAAPVTAGIVPSCPKCGVPMVLRTAARGDRKGEQFYGCENYPKCRETLPFTEGPATA